MIYTSACVCLHVRSAPCAMYHRSLSLEELPCIAEHQPYTKLASGGDVGQAGNDAAFKHREGGGGLPDNGRQAEGQCAEARGAMVKSRWYGRRRMLAFGSRGVILSMVPVSDLIIGRSLPDQKAETSFPVCWVARFVCVLITGHTVSP